MKLSVIIPCYNSTHVLVELVEKTIEELKKLPLDSWEFILVNDFSPHPDTIVLLRGLAATYPFVKVVDLAKNFGQANAQMAALHYATGDLILNMDDDMQTHPKNIPILFNKLMEGYDLVLGSYRQKRHSFFRRLLTKMGDKFDELCLERPKGMAFTSFWITKKFVRDELIHYQYPFSYMEGLFLRTVRNIANVEIEHFERKEGHSGYNLKKLVKLWSNFTNFTVMPLRIAGILGGVSALLGFCYAVVTVIRKIMHPGMMAGYASLLCVMLLFFGITLICIGALGEYVGRTFLCVNKSPQYVVRQTYNVDEKPKEEL